MDRWKFVNEKWIPRPVSRGEGFVSGIAVSPSNLRPFGAPPSIGRRELSTRAPSLGRGCRAQRGGVGFLFAAKPPPLCLPHREGGPRQRRSGALVYRRLETISFALFHTASTLSGSLRSPPSPRGEGFVSGIPLSPSNLRPFGAPPSIGRRECPHEPLPLEGATERSEAGLASFFAEAASSLPSSSGRGTA